MNNTELNELQIRLQRIKSEPNGIVRETMIDNFLIDMDGIQPIKNEQSGSAQTWSLIASKVINLINVPNVDKDPNGAIEAMESLHLMNELISSINNIELSITRILTAAKVSTVDEVISKIERYDPLESQVVELLGVSKCKNVLEVVQMLGRHPLSPEDIERAASKYAFENNTHRSNSKAFIAGANFAKQPHSNVDMPTNTQLLRKVESISNNPKYQEGYMDGAVYIKSLLPHPPKK